MKRKLALEYIKAAGYENDMRQAMRVYTETRSVGYQAFMEAWRLGIEIREKQEAKAA